MSGSLVVFEATARRLGAIALPDNAQWELRMHIKSASSNKVYTVARRKSDRTWGCDCMGWKRHRNCKHLTAMVPALESALRTSAAAADTVKKSKPIAASRNVERDAAERLVVSARHRLEAAETMLRDAQSSYQAAAAALREAEAALRAAQ